MAAAPPTYPNPPGTTGLQGGSESSGTGATNGTLTNNGDGTYRYVFRKNLTAAVMGTTPITYERNLTHRVVIMLGGHAGPTDDDTFDFVPDGRLVTENARDHRDRDLPDLPQRERVPRPRRQSPVHRDVRRVPCTWHDRRAERQQPRAAHHDPQDPRGRRAREHRGHRRHRLEQPGDDRRRVGRQRLLQALGLPRLAQRLVEGRLPRGDRATVRSATRAAAPMSTTGRPLPRAPHAAPATTPSTSRPARVTRAARRRATRSAVAATRTPTSRNSTTS